ncbi:DUF2197 domain-containing protein [Paenibacillus gorillae]|uniref:DUF2197 domain-containing protein n=1 Tax=Paenibacillus gorillae TaxID=1243662 RepID=UPI0005A68C2E
MILKCMFCKKERSIESEVQYRAYKDNPAKKYICKECNDSIQNDARKNVDFSPELIDPYKIDKLIP